MKQNNILICDKDEGFVKALVSYLMSRDSTGGPGISVMGISDTNDFEKLSGNYELGFLASPFLEESPLVNGLRIKNTIQLSEEDADKEDAFYKYQNMEAIESVIRSRLHINRVERKGKDESGIEIYGVYSPGKHELTLPFSLCTCKLLGNEGGVLFLDLSEIGILHSLIGESLRDLREDLIDVIYMLENGDVGGGLDRYIASFEGISLLTPVATPSQLSYITPDQWKLLFEKIEGSGYRRVVVLFGSLIQGFSELAGRLKSLLVLKKNGDYYEIADHVFMDFMEKLALRDLCREIVLPMSASNLSHGGFRMEALLKGRLMDFVRDEIGGRIGELAGSF